MEVGGRGMGDMEGDTRKYEVISKETVIDFENDKQEVGRR